ncbi:MAG: PilC/PilY family type IV pilus protein [Nitrosomonadaceae bacterium]|nr:PilC/PilY family type IV pilus protein [Nitrosomonadaceae bacterium]
MSFPWKKNLLAAILIGVSTTVLAEDIDLFVGAAPSTTADVPNVLIIMDNTANWSTAFTNERAALASVLSGLAQDKFKVGLMMFSEEGGDNGKPDGSYVRAALRLMNATNKPLYQNLINSLDVKNDKSDNGKLGLAMAEAYYYFTGANTYAGHNKAKRDYAGNSVAGYPSSNAVYALTGNAFASSSSTAYQNPVDSGCQKNFIIYISNGAVQDNSSDTSTANTKLAAAGGSTTQITLSPSGSQANAADEWARFMATTASVKVVTYTLDVDPVTSGQGPGFTALLKSMANVSKGKYFKVDSSVSSGAQISDAFNQIFGEIQAINSVFASASLPVSVNAQGTHLNQVFIGIFRPDANAAPRWNGNMKQYQFKASLSGGKIVLNLVDADDNLAINNNTGFLTQCARSFWTPTVVDNYWTFNPQGSCTAIANSDVSNYPDGDVVEKGAAAYMLRAIAPVDRVVKTCDSANCAGVTDFNNANSAITQALLTAANSAERTDIINWVRGTDIKNENGNASITEMRPSVHGDVLHSRPVAVDYGGSTGVVVFYGANDGMLRAINGNQTASIGIYPAGSELWSFVAPEHYSKLKRIYDNSPLVSYPGLPTTTPAAQPKPYFFDGSVVAHQDSATATVWIYATQRRGGRMLYAFDVSTPASPSLKWRKGCPNLTNDTGCTSADFTGIGQTWSAPKVLKASGYASGNVPLLIMGGGYDTCEDAEPNTCTSPKGNKVYVLDANDGTLLIILNTERSVAADITVVRDSSGLAQYAYVVDTGGNIYRITIGSAVPASWSITRIAALGCDSPVCSGGAANRKFLFAAEVVVTPDYNAILVGSGDREHPLLSNTVTAGVDNAFFMIKDRPTDVDWWPSESANCQSQPLACLNSLLAIDPDGATSSIQAQLDAKKGWYLAFGTGTHDGEQVVTSAVVALGVLTFSTHTPTAANPAICGSNLGTARVYNVKFLDATAAVGAPRYIMVTGGGLPPSPVAGMVTVNNPSSPGSTMTVSFVMGANPTSPLEGSVPLPAATSASAKSRVYWMLKQ